MFLFKFGRILCVEGWAASEKRSYITKFKFIFKKAREKRYGGWKIRHDKFYSLNALWFQRKEEKCVGGCLLVCASCHNGAIRAFILVLSDGLEVVSKTDQLATGRRHMLILSLKPTFFNRS